MIQSGQDKTIYTKRALQKSCISFSKDASSWPTDKHQSCRLPRDSQHQSIMAEFWGGGGAVLSSHRKANHYERAGYTSSCAEL